MNKTSERRLWVVAHLLFPNSSQALDVYTTILNLVSKKSDPDYAKNIFRKLAQLFFKTNVVRSSQPFQVFENEKLDSWNGIYHRSPKQQLIAICGLVVFEFTTADLSDVLDIPEHNIKFLINQSFKKTSQLGIVKPAIKTDLIYKKQAENQISYLYTNENLVEYALGLLSEAEKKRVEQGLAVYKQLVPLYAYYKEIIDEIRLIANNQKNNYYLQSIEESDQQTSEQTGMNFNFFKMRKSFAILSAASIVFIALVSIRPHWLQTISFKSSSNSIVVQEIKNQPTINEKESNSKIADEAVNLHEMPVAKNETDDSKPTEVVVAKQDKPEKLEKIEKKAAVVAESKPDPLPESMPTVAKADPKPIAKESEHQTKKVSGLYRASIVVTDLDVTSSKITEKLVSLGSKKAGEVELGWKKTPALAYYHLTIPEENLEAAKSFIQNFGKLNIQFENHPRLLPAGTSRIILEVKESE